MPLIRKPSQPSAAASVDLTKGSVDARWSAARALAGKLEGVPDLAAALAGEQDARVREAIFTSLARTATPEAVEAVSAYIGSSDVVLRTGALDALRAMPHAALPKLSALLVDPDPDVRLLSCEVARGLSTDEATALMASVLQVETEPNVCAAAVDVLSEIGGPEALPALHSCAERFAAEPFLVFSIRVAIERIGAQRGG